MRFIPVAALVLLAATTTFAQQGRGGGPFPRMQPLAVPDAPREFTTISQPIRVGPFVRDLVAPWSIACLPNGAENRLS